MTASGSDIWTNDTRLLRALIILHDREHDTLERRRLKRTIDMQRHIIEAKQLIEDEKRYGPQ